MATSAIAAADGVTDSVSDNQVPLHMIWSLQHKGDSSREMEVGITIPVLFKSVLEELTAEILPGMRYW